LKKDLWVANEYSQAASNTHQEGSSQICKVDKSILYQKEHFFHNSRTVCVAHETTIKLVECVWVWLPYIRIDLFWQVSGWKSDNIFGKYSSKIDFDQHMCYHLLTSDP